MKNLLTAAVIFIIGLIIGLSLKKAPATKTVYKLKKDTIVTYDVRTDTLFVYQDPEIIHDTIWMPAPETSYEDDQGQVRNVYQDTSIIEDDYFLFYTADITGKLNFIDLGYYDNRVTKMPTKTITKTVDRFIDPKGLYVGGVISHKAEITPAALYLWDRNVVQAGYNLNTQQVTFGYFRKIGK